DYCGKWLLYERLLASLLRKVGYPYPYQRSHYIAASAQALYGQERSLSDVLASSTDPNMARRLIVALTKGVGPKQASLFLRNTRSHKVAILDAHVLRYLALTEVISWSTVRRLPT